MSTGIGTGGKAKMAQNTHKGTENLASSMFALRTPSVGFYGGQLYVFFIYMAEGKSKHKIHARSLKKALGRFQLGLQV